MGGIIFHEKKAGYSDGYKVWGDIVLPTNSTMLDTLPTTFVAYALFGCHSNGYGNFDAGLQVCGNGQYKLCLNGGKPETSVLKLNNGVAWYESAKFNASGTITLTAELIYVSPTKGKARVSTGEHSVEAEFATGLWENKFQNGVCFWKEMTVASNQEPFTNLWSTQNIALTQTVYMSDMTFKEVKYKRHSGGNIDYSLDSAEIITTGTPKLDGQSTGSMPTWDQMIYGTASNGYSNTFSIDCR